MTYNTLEAITRQAACKTLGARSKDFDKWLVTCDPNEDIEIEDFDHGTSVELSFDPSISPFTYFSSDVVFFVNLSPNGVSDVQAFFGSSCSDTVAAELSAAQFLTRDDSDGWYVEEDFGEESGLHLMHTFVYDPEDDRSAEDAIASCFAELLENETADRLRSFVHYFED